jgi:hypothetical protein
VMISDPNTITRTDLWVFLVRSRGDIVAQCIPQLFFEFVFVVIIFFRHAAL